MERFVTGDVGPYEWDDFESVGHPDRTIQVFVWLVWQVAGRFPPRNKTEFCASEAAPILLNLAKALRTDSIPNPTEEEFGALKAGKQVPARFLALIQSLERSPGSFNRPDSD